MTYKGRNGAPFGMNRTLAAGLGALAVGAAITAVAFAQPPQPAARPANAGDPAAAAPARGGYNPPADIAYRTVDIMSENVRLQGEVFYLKSNEGKRLPTIVTAHGWGGTGSGLRPDNVELAQNGYAVVSFDYRGWGASDSRVVLTGRRPAGPAGGTYTAEVKELREYVDPFEQTEDWFNVISWTAIQPFVDPDRIGIRGTSFSGGHVIYVAAMDPRVKALVSQVGGMNATPEKLPGAPGSAAEVRARYNRNAGEIAAGTQQYPTPRLQTVGALFGSPPGNKLLRWNVTAVADRITQPTLIIAADAEELFKNEDGPFLACERVKGPRKLINIPNITHYGIYGPERDLAIKTAIDWFDTYLKAPGSARRIPASNEPARGACNPRAFTRPAGVSAAVAGRGAVGVAAPAGRAAPAAPAGGRAQ